VVNATSPYRTLADLIAGARAKPGELSMAGTGPGATQHIGIEQFKRAVGVNMIYVPFAGGAPAINALLGGHVTSVLQNYSEVGEQLKAGTLRALATMSAKRLDPLPDVPTVAELGHPGFEVEVWFGMMAPAKTPKAATEELATWFSAALRDPEITPKLATLGFYPVGMCGDAYAAHIRKESDNYGRIIRDASIKAE
jgi:tripartite-type tricarboxylate transporter receptor subunit TctC